MISNIKGLRGGSSCPTLGLMNYVSLGESLIFVSFSKWGPPFLHKKIIGIKYYTCKTRSVALCSGYPFNRAHKSRKGHASAKEAHLSHLHFHPSFILQTVFPLLLHSTSMILDLSLGYLCPQQPTLYLGSTLFGSRNSSAYVALTSHLLLCGCEI